MTKKQEKAINQLHEDFGKLFHTWKSDNNIDASLVLSLAIPLETYDKRMPKLFKEDGNELTNSITTYLTVYQSEREKFFKKHVHSLIDSLRASYGDEYDKQNLYDTEESEE